MIIHKNYSTSKRLLESVQKEQHLFIPENFVSAIIMSLICNMADGVNIIFFKKVLRYPQFEKETTDL